MTDIKDKQEEVDSGEDENYDPQAEVHGNWKQVDLPVLPVVSGEEDEEVINKFRSKLYRWRKQWKQRGVGQLKFLKHKKTGAIRILMRAEKTHKIIANHYLQKKQPFCNLEQMKTANNSWTWAAYDVSDEKPQNEKFCARFLNKDDFDKFKEFFDQYCKQNEAAIAAFEKSEANQEKKEQTTAEQPKKKNKKNSDR